MNWPKLPKPPIKEAVFDLKFEGNDVLTIETLKAFCDSLNEGYPVMNEMFLFKVEPKFDEQKIDSKRLSTGFRLSNQKRSFIIQIRRDGFTFSKVEPYISWEEIELETKPLVSKLWKTFPNLRINRIALRYINNFDLSFDAPINEYLSIQPSYPLELPQTVDAFLVKLVIPKKEYDLKGIIHMGIDPIANSDIRYKVTFDIDVFKEANYSKDDEGQMFGDFNKIRDFKNEIFFSGLTEKTQAHFN